MALSPYTISIDLTDREVVRSDIFFFKTMAQLLQNYEDFLTTLDTIHGK